MALLCEAYAYGPLVSQNEGSERLQPRQIQHTPESFARSF
jgi:hypothetical protein